MTDHVVNLKDNNEARASSVFDLKAALVRQPENVRP